MAVKKITKRWLFNNFGVILVILIALEIAFTSGIQAFYYNNVHAALLAQANVVRDRLNIIAEDSSADVAQQVRALVETFTERERMELMAIDNDGKVVFTSSGFAPETSAQIPDYQQSLLTASGQITDRFTGVIGNEKIMSIILVPPFSDPQTSAMRFAVSLNLVDQQIILFILILTLIGIAIICFVTFSSSYFINSIVNPVGEVGETARRIAHGDFEVRLSKKNDDEIGELCDTINYMAEELATSEKMKNDFISSVSHELRTPLTAIKGWAETIASMGGDVDGEMLGKGMRVITGETERLARMVEELLDFSRIQNERMQLNKDKIDLVAELSDAVLMFEEPARREQKELIYEEPDAIVPFFGDRNRLRQVFANIIDNALKYSDAGDRVTVWALIAPADITIVVQDTGCGIRAVDLPKVKEKFFKANSTRRGSGIGLAVADELVRMHGGTLEVDSTEHVGTTVTITLPLVERLPS